MSDKAEKIIVIDPAKIHPLHVLAFVETFAIVLFLGFLFGRGFFKPNRDAPVNTITFLTEKLSDIGELSTLQYDYDAVDRVQSAKARWYGLNVPGTDDIIEIKISGTIKFGINLRSIQIFAEEDDNGNIKIRIPKAKILSHELDHKTAEITSLKENFLNNLQQSYGSTFSSANEAFFKIKEEREKSEKIRECIETASENAKFELEALLRPLVPKEKSLQFEFF